MATEDESVAITESEIDWDHVLRFLRRRLSFKISGIDASTLHDLTQEACIRFLRVLRREGVRTPDALLTTIADRVALSHMRRAVRERAILEPLTAEMEDCRGTRPAVLEVPGDLQERLELVVQEVFRSQRSSCAELASAFFDRRDWKSVAVALGVSHEAIRARWARCLALLRKIASTDPEFRILLGMGAD